MAKRGITLSTVGVGNDIDEALLKRFARLGQGRFYRVSDPKTLPKIFVKEALTLRVALIRELTFVPRVRKGAGALVAGIESTPPLLGMIRTWPKALPGVQVPIVSDTGEPILASWRVGLGQVVAFTSDAQRRWANVWVASPTFDKLWNQIVRGVARPGASGDVQAIITPTTSNQLKIRAEVTGADDGFQNFLGISAKVFGPDPTQPPRLVQLVQTGPGTYEGDVPAPDSGAYLAVISFGSQKSSYAWTAASYVVDASTEWHDLSSNESELRNIATRTGGRLIEPFDRSVDLFDRNDLHPESTSQSLTDQLLAASMLTLLLDVAVRRIAWDRYTFSAIGHALGNIVRSYTQVRVSGGQSAIVALRALRTTRESINAKSDVEPKLNPPIWNDNQNSNAMQIANLTKPALHSTQGQHPESPFQVDNSDVFQRLAEAKRRAQPKADK
jgi:hypothetical protein